MTKHATVIEVGAPDPELENSPIFDYESEWAEYQDLELETGVCYFNGETYPLGEYVSSGGELLRCMEKGVWVRVGSSQVK
ncbi:MAG: hypothetical protein OEQ39_29410 [Gammaproteobacteria bacterium]|nr:hypothetical protein [Gammaproteobacteria bacterium]MDH3381048.1 hypothetical protein [Gammaproteobacteria bacterium]